MEPYDSPEEAAFRAEALAFLGAHASLLPENVVSPSAIIAEWSPEEEDQRLGEAKRWQRLKFDSGWAGISWPKEYGGRGGSLMEDIIFRMEEAHFDVPHDILVVGLGWCGPALLAHGTQAQRDRFLPRVLSGDDVWCQLFSEPGAGSDLAGLSTRAIRDGDEWVISGQKVWTTFAHRSDWGMCIARHDPSAQKHQGLSAFMVDMKAPGVSARPLRQMTDSANFNEVFLDEVRVPDENRIGEIGDGWRIVTTTFMWERINVLPGGERIIDALIRLVRENAKLDDPLVRDRVADIYARAGALRSTMLRLLTSISQGSLPGPEGSIMKLAATDLLTDVFDLALDVLGPEAVLLDGSGRWAREWQAGFLGTPGLRIGGGTDQVQRNIIGERVLGLPKEPRVDLDVPFEELVRSTDA